MIPHSSKKYEDAIRNNSQLAKPFKLFPLMGLTPIRGSPTSKTEYLQQFFSVSTVDIRLTGLVTVNCCRYGTRIFEILIHYKLSSDKLRLGERECSILNAYVSLVAVYAQHLRTFVYAMSRTTTLVCARAWLNTGHTAYLSLKLSTISSNYVSCLKAAAST